MPTVWSGVWDSPFTFSSQVSPFNLGPPIIWGSKVPSFSLSTLHMLPLNSPNGGMDKGHVWVWSTIQTKRNQNASKWEGFE